MMFGDCWVKTIHCPEASDETFQLKKVGETSPQDEGIGKHRLPWQEVFFGGKQLQPASPKKTAFVS